MPTDIQSNFLGKIVPNGFNVEGKMHKVCFSLCLSINPDCTLLADPAHYNDFYTSVLALKNISFNAVPSVKINGGIDATVKNFSRSDRPLNLYKQNLVDSPITDWSSLKNELWQAIFPELPVNKTEKYRRKIIGNAVENFYDSLAHVAALRKSLKNGDVVFAQKTKNEQKSFIRDQILSLKKINTPSPHFDLLNKVHRNFDNYQKNAKIKFFELAKKYAEKGAMKQWPESERLSVDRVYNTYVNCGEIDIDEIVNSFSTIATDPVLGRIFGFIIDFEFNWDPQVSILSTSISLPASWSIYTFTTNICTVNIDNKYAYLAQVGSSSFFEHSVLVPSDYVELKTQDELTTEERIYQLSENGNRNAAGDGSTRGILYNFLKLNELIKPISKITAEQVLDEEHLTQGIRVVGGIRSAGSIKWYSLTGRGLKLYSKDHKEIFCADNVENCLHIDSPTEYMDDDGTQKHTIAETMFEYSEGLLTLKSAFAKATTSSLNQRQVNHVSNLHDEGLRKSQARFENNIGIYKFPFTEIISEEAKAKLKLTCSYDIPDSIVGNGPKLRFKTDEIDNEYTFIVSQQYLNGWGLPLRKEETQLSIEDMVANEAASKYYPAPIPFIPNENTKPVLLIHTKPVSDDVNLPITEKESLEHIVVRGNNDRSARHILPPRIAMETAFWYNLLSAPNMTDDIAYNWKCRYNCSFTTYGDYEKFTSKNVDGISQKCNEGCSHYCGGTAMKDHYVTKYIHPNHLSDPSVKGFGVELFWDKDYLKQVIPSSKFGLTFGGTAGIAPRSCRLILRGDSDIAFEVNSENDAIEISLKKGMIAYVQLTNALYENFREHLSHGWWKNYGIDLHAQELEVNKNLPKKITFTHAAKQPLVDPAINILASTPADHKMIEHINEWLKTGNYEIYKPGLNIVAERKDKSSELIVPINSTYTKVSLTAHFERLDAIGKIEFLPDIKPTGSLELWMRKEEYIDDERQLVQDPEITDSSINHLPFKPVLDFNNRNNLFMQDYKIDFSNAIMDQLKTLKNVDSIDEIKDPYRAIISKINLEYDFKTTKFEEREYYLKNISSFIGYFTNQKPVDSTDDAINSTIEEYTLPQIENVMNEDGLRFKIMVLNNSQPRKPEIAYAVTTIEEEKCYNGNSVTSIQKGNIITVYLRRGRLTSGKDERVGVIVDAASLYNKVFKENNFISKAGRDIVSDRFSNRSQYLQYEDIIMDEQCQNGIYKAGYDNELGVFHFLPQFDYEKQLWKFEVKLDIKTTDNMQLHNPFINLSLVHYQPFSINYNNKTSESLLQDIQYDCRISDIENSTWCYLLPERKVSLSFSKTIDNRSLIDMNFHFHYESLHHFHSNVDNWIVRTNFIVTVQANENEEFSENDTDWVAIQSTCVAKTAFHHTLLTRDLLFTKGNLVKLKLAFEHINIYNHIRTRIIEIEWFTDETWEEILIRTPNLLIHDPVNNEELRIKYVDYIY